MQKEQFKNIFDFQKKSKIKAGDGFKLGEAHYPFYTSSNILTKSIDEYLFEDESLIFGTGGLASIHFCNEKFAVSTDCFVTQPKDNKQVFSKFVYYYLSGNMNILENGFKGAGLKHISKDYLENIEIPLPPFATQQKIAAILDQADALIQNNRTIVQKYDALTRSLFLEMFGDLKVNNHKFSSVTLAHACSLITDGAHRTPKLLDEGVPFMTVANMEEFDFNFNKCKKISENEFLDLVNNNCQPEINDILFSKDGTVGKVLRIRKKHKLVLLSSIAILRFKKSINPVFAENLLKSDYFFNQAVSRKSGSAIRRIVLKDIKKTTFITPPIDLQNQFAERVQLIETQKQLALEALAKSEALFQSLLQQAFKGELS
jgi:type I restriction enzyme S subunit